MVLVDHGQIKILLVISLFLDCGSISNQSQPPQKLWIWTRVSLCAIGFQTFYGEENSQSGKLKNTWAQDLFKAASSPLLLYFPHSTGCVSQDGSLKMFKLTDNAAVVGLITDDESLYIASDGSAVERYSIRRPFVLPKQVQQWKKK